MSRIRSTFPMLLGLAAAAVIALAPASRAADALRPFERVGRTGQPAATHAATPMRALGVSTVVVNAAWTGLIAGTPVTVGASGYTIGTDAFASVQAGIDAVDPNGTIKVLPGDYSETASNRLLYDNSGPYQFGLFFSSAKGALTLQGVDAAGNPITSSAAAAVVSIVTNATNDFGPSGVFVEGDGVTIAGVRIGMNNFGQNKTFEVIGDAFALRNCDLADLGGSVYFGDYRFDAVHGTSHIQSYQVTGNLFEDGLSLDVTSGTGVTGPVSGRIVSGNTFRNGAGDYWPSISYSGSDTGVPWFVYTVGGVTITGNTFTDLYPQGQLIRARGTYDNSQFDWASYFGSNTFDRVACVGPNAPTTLTTFQYPSSYGIFQNVRRLGSSVQGEVDNALAGDVVRVGSGTYPEQVVIDSKSLTVQGAGHSATRIQCPAGTLPVSFSTSAVNHPLVLATNAADVRLADLSVDGAGQGASNYRFIGAAWFNAGGKLTNCDVLGVRETPFNGDQHGVGVYVYETTAGPFAFEMGGSTVSDFQKNATVFYGPTLTVNVHDCTVTGQGHTALNAQNGFQFGSVAGGSLSNCSVTNIYYTNLANALSCGVLIYGGGNVTVTGANVFTGCQTGVYYEETNGSVSGASITGAVWAALAYDLQTSATNRAQPASAQAGGHRPPTASPFDGNSAPASKPGMSAMSTGMSLAISNCDFFGDGTLGGNAVFATSAGAPVTVTCTGLDMRHWDMALQTWGPATITASRNSITGSVTAGYDNTMGTLPQMATLNWWGAASGPSGVGHGTGDAVANSNVTFDPWLTNGVDILPGVGFATGPDNVVGPVAPTGCLSIANPVLTIPVNIARTTSDNIRGFSVRVQLSSNLQLATGSLASIVQGSYLSSVTSTTFQVVDRTAGLYSVDCAILGTPCGATAATGTLFTIAVRRVSDGPASISIPAVILRDCSNASVPGTPGAEADFTVDGTAPTAIANLVATPQLTGNDHDGTTKIQLTFTPPAGGGTVEIYRAPFGHYPYYDGQGGIVPSVPAYPPAAPWTLTAVTASGQSDEPAARDFWYYVAFSHDGCGNLSAVGNRTNGTLNYHLGDVTDPHNGLAVGDNLVDVADISRLGSHYGITLGAADSLGLLDVGPTTDLSANSRPVTDGFVDFEDLIVFAMNYGPVSSAPMMATRPAAAAHDALSLDIPALPEPGGSFDVAVRMSGTGQVLGASVQLAWDPAVVEPMGVTAGDLLAKQGRGSVVLSPSAGAVDAALLGGGGGMVGEGSLALVTFRVKAAGEPAVRIAHATARDGENHPVVLGTLSTGASAPPARTELGNVFPNPFGHMASVQLSLAREGMVKVGVFDLAGRRVRTLVNGLQPAGVRILTFDGRGESGLRLAPGVYVMRMETAGVVQSRRLQLVP